ncbi:hypothetical protein [Serratia fonticola]
MPLDYGFISAIAAVTTIARNAKELRGDENPHISPAIAALSSAVNETEMYFRDRALLGAEKSQEREDALCRLWSNAAEPVRLVSLELSNLCAYKAAYWLFPDRYSPEDVKALNITLVGMKRELQSLRYGEH